MGWNFTQLMSADVGAEQEACEALQLEEEEWDDMQVRTSTSWPVAFAIGCLTSTTWPFSIVLFTLFFSTADL